MDAADWSVLKATALFSEMPAEDARTLIGNQSPRVYEKGVTLFRQGEPATAFFVIVSGWVKLYRITPDGIEVVLHVFTKAETFAEAAMFLGGRYPASAETVTPARLLRIEAAVFRARIHERPDLALSMLASASQQLKSLIGHIEQIKVPARRRSASPSSFLGSCLRMRTGLWKSSFHSRRTCSPTGSA